MRRSLLLLLALVGLAAAEPDLLAGSAAARVEAEQQLEAARRRIATEQAALLGELQAEIAAGAAIRERLATAEREAKAAAEDLAASERDHERDLAMAKQVVDRAAIAARLGTDAAGPSGARLEAAISALGQRLATLPRRLSLRLEDGPVIDRQGRIATVPVLHLGEARHVALGADPAARGLLERTADGGSWLVGGPALPDAVLPRDGRVRRVALDAAGTAARQGAEVHRSFPAWVAAGRFFIWPIFAVLAAGVILMLERTIVLARRRVEPARLAEVAGLLAAGDADAARRTVETGATPLDRLLRAGLGSMGRPREVREAAVEQVLLAETASLTRGLPAIAVLAGVAPLLGLLGTVTGMIDLFGVIAAQGSGSARSLSGGISEALICTQAGMLVAIPLLLAHAWIGRLADRRSQVLEEAACAMLGLGEGGA